MPRGVYLRTEKHKESLRKIKRYWLRGNTYGFKKGQKAWNKGLHIYLGGKRFEKGQKPWNTGKNFSGNSGHKHTEEWKEIMRKKITGKKYPQCSGKNHFRWKGNKVGYHSLHNWVRRYLGIPFKCNLCGKIGKKVGRNWNIHWANIDHNYKRNLTDWISLCVKCHKHYDGYGGEI